MPSSRLSVAASCELRHALWSASTGESQGFPVVRRTTGFPATDKGLRAADDGLRTADGAVRIADGGVRTTEDGERTTGAVVIGATAGAFTFPVSATELSASALAPGASRPIESTSMVSRLASARSARKAESAARSAGVFDLLPLSHAPEKIKTNARQIVRHDEDLYITLDESRWLLRYTVALQTPAAQGIQSR